MVHISKNSAKFSLCKCFRSSPRDLPHECRWARASSNHVPVGAAALSAVWNPWILWDSARFPRVPFDSKPWGSLFPRETHKTCTLNFSTFNKKPSKNAPGVQFAQYVSPIIKVLAPSKGWENLLEPANYSIVNWSCEVCHVPLPATKKGACIMKLWIRKSSTAFRKYHGRPYP